MWTSSPCSSLLVSWAISVVLFLATCYFALCAHIQLRRYGTNIVTFSLPSLNNLFVIGVVLVVCVSLVYWFETKEWRIEEMHNVRVVSRDSPYRFTAEVEDPDTHRWNRFIFVSCPNYIPTPEITDGVTLDLLKYEERPGCMDVSKHNTGYILRRDMNGKPTLRVAESR